MKDRKIDSGIISCDEYDQLACVYQGTGNRHVAAQCRDFV